MFHARRLFLIVDVAVPSAATETRILAISKGRLIMYIGGGLVTLVIVVLVVLFLLRR